MHLVWDHLIQIININSNNKEIHQYLKIHKLIELQVMQILIK